MKWDRWLLSIMVLLVVAVLFPPSAHADTTPDDLFWTEAQYWGFGSKLARNAAISVAKTMCSFRDGSETPGDEAAFLADRFNVSEYKAGGFVGSAITVYCPEQAPPDQ
jgi:hypothetical protein